MSKAPTRPEGTKRMSTFALIFAMMTSSISTLDLQGVLNERTEVAAASHKGALDVTAKIREMIAQSGVFGNDNQKQV